jgi:predicted kinase
MKLIILNGPLGVGKSTLALKLNEQMPSSVLVDVDELRRAIPNYRENREESLRLVYKQTAQIIGEELAKGNDVIVDKAISYSDTIDTFIKVGKEQCADIYEFLLFADKETIRKRADERGYRPGGMLTPEKVDELWEKSDALRKERSQAIFIDARDPELIYEKVQSFIAKKGFRHRPRAQQ